MVTGAPLNGMKRTPESAFTVHSALLPLWFFSFTFESEPSGLMVNPRCETPDSSRHAETALFAFCITRQTAPRLGAAPSTSTAGLSARPSSVRQRSGGVSMIDSEHSCVKPCSTENAWVVWKLWHSPAKQALPFHFTSKPRLVTVSVPVALCSCWGSSYFHLYDQPFFGFAGNTTMSLAAAEMIAASSAERAASRSR